MKEHSSLSAKYEGIYRQLFEQMHDGYALHEILCDEAGHPVDYRFLKVNPAFEEMTGLRAKEVVGRTVLEVLPHTEKEWIETYGKVALSGKPIHFERFSQELNRHFKVTAFCTTPGQFACSFSDITERVQAEDQYRTLFNNTSVSILIVEPRTMRILDANPAVSDLYGYYYSELLEINYLDLNAEKENSVQAARRLDHEGRMSFKLGWHKKKDGTPFPVEIDRFPSRFKGMRVECIVIKDVTDRNGIAVRTREQQGHYEDLFNEAPLGYQSLDENGHFLDVNEAWLTTLGYDRQEVIGQWFGDFLPNEQQETFQARFQQFKEAGRVHSEFEMLHKNGQRRNIAFEGRIKHKEDGSFERTHCILQDFTEQKETEDRLKSLEALQHKMIANIGDVIVIIGKDGRFRYNSPNMEKWFGWAPENLNDRTLWEYVHPEDINSVKAFFKTIIDSDQDTNTFQWRLKCKNTEYKWIEFTGFNFLDDKDIKGILGNYRDITERRKKDEQLMTLQRQLSQAQKMEAVGRLAGGIAHDFNNMLAVILGNTELIMDGLSPKEPLFADLREIQTAADNSVEIIRQLLTFARKQTIEPKVLNLNQSIEGMLKMLRRLIGENIVLDWKPKLGLFPVKIDPTQLNQILANIIVNARDAILDVGTVTIETGTAEFDESYCDQHEGFRPGTYTFFSVCDDGVGMDKETLNGIFEPFFTTKETGKGTGLGLAMVYGAVKQNSGFINVYSEPGLGARFTTYLPIVENGDQQICTRTYRPESISTRNKTILLVEDELTILEMTTRMLERLGYIVIGASSPEQGIKLAQSFKGDIHLLITDVIMPGMNGHELAKSILNIFPGIRCLFMSGYTANVIAHKGILDPGVHFIQKPFSLKVLDQKLTHCLKPHPELEA